MLSRKVLFCVILLAGEFGFGLVICFLYLSFNAALTVIMAIQVYGINDIKLKLDQNKKKID